MNWKSGPGWQMQTSGAYVVTKHESEAAPKFYIAWHGRQELGSFITAEAARAACDAHEAKA